MIDGFAHHQITLDDALGETEYVDLDEAARRMELTKMQIMHLIRIHALRFQMVGNEPWVVPAILTGAVPQ